VSGPLAFDLIVSPSAVATKKMTDDPVAGQADAIIFERWLCCGDRHGREGANLANKPRRSFRCKDGLCRACGNYLWSAQMILVLNAGSSSLKVEVFDLKLRSVLSGAVTNIGTSGTLSLDGKTDVETKDHADALTQMLAALATAGITLDKLTAAAHRVVHGGTILTAPARVTPQVIAAIESVIPLAPFWHPSLRFPRVELRKHGRRFRR